VIGIVASRIAERHHRPAILIALEGDEGSGSGRSIPAFDLLGGLHAGARYLTRYGGHKAAAGLSIARDQIEAFRATFLEHAAEVLRPEDLMPEVRIDAIAQGDVLSLDLAEELQALAPFGQGNPPVSLLVPAAHLRDPHALGENGRHVRFTLAAGGTHSRCVHFGNGATLPVGPDEPADAAVRLEIDRFNGAVSPRLVLRRAQPCRPRPIEILGEPVSFAAGLLRELDRDLATARPTAAAAPLASRTTRDLRGSGIAGLLADLVATGEPLLAVVAHAPHRAGTLAARVGGFALTSWCALRDDPALAVPFTHVVAIDPPAFAVQPAGEGWTHLAWGAPELDFALRIHEWDFALRDPLTAVYRALKAANSTSGEATERLLRGEGPQPRSAALAGRLVRVLTELELASFDREGLGLRAVENPQRTQLERSAAYGAYQQQLEDGRQFLTSNNMKRAAA
jgi:single-stranded-DNA-specific exonuclease